MEIVIWGVGIRGKKFANFIGYKNVKAFVDSRHDLLENVYKEIPIIGIEQYIKEYRNYFLVVSPQKNEDIIDVLKKNGIRNYFLFSDFPSEILCGQIQNIDEISLPEFDGNEAVIYGNSLYSILLWERMQNKWLDIPLVTPENDLEYKKMLKSISPHVYCEKEYTFLSDNIIVQTIKERPTMAGKIIDLYHLTDWTDRFYYPKLQKFYNMYLNESCFIVGNGSSLSEEDLEVLYYHKILCFGMNGIPLLFKNTIWRPDFYVCEDGNALDVYGELILKGDMKNVFVSDVNNRFLDRVKTHNEINIFHTYLEDYYPELPRFSEDITRNIVCGFTVTYICMQIAVYMGFHTIYLLGIDFDYDDNDTVEVKHFSNDYQLDKGKINPCRKKENLLAYQMAKKYADSHKIEIYNATRGGRLEVFKRVNFDSIFKK